MESLLIRFEQKRGHSMIIERNPALTRAEMNETQLQMLKTCDVPGLLPLETEECDGQLSLRYSISGKRMFSEAMRASFWSMFEMMGALCRLGEVLEQCRLYLLDGDRIRLQDEYIFVGDEWHDLCFTYIPIDMPTLRHSDDLERLIIRWVLKVKEPDGLAIQQVLRIVATQGFKPISLSRYARQYLTGYQEAEDSLSTHPSVPSISPTSIPARDSIPTSMPVSVPLVENQLASQEKSKPVAVKPPRSWDVFQPPSGDPHSLSEMWSEDSAPFRTDQTMDISRWRVFVACAAIILATVGWKFIYLQQPNEQRLVYCIIITLVSGAGILLLWNGLPSWVNRIRGNQLPNHSRNTGQAFQQDEEEVNDECVCEDLPRFASHIPIMETSRITATNDQTAHLNKNDPKKEAFYLVWESKEAAHQRIPLQGNSLVIGRSSEASGHVDATMGISRAHAELVRIEQQWKVKDLGSRNGTRLNDKPMVPYELYSLQHGDRLSLAESQYQFHHPH